MDDLGTWLAAQWAHFSAWTERPLSNGTLLWVGVALAWQMWGGTNRTVDAIGNMTEAYFKQAQAAAGAADSAGVFYTGTAAGAFTIPAAAAGNAGKEITIKNKTAFAITITPATGNIYIDNDNKTAANVRLGIEASNNWIKLVSDGSQWNVLRALF